MIRIAVITGTTRPGTKAPAVAEWIIAQAKDRVDAEFIGLDIADFHLPLLDEPVPPMRGQYTKDHTKRWSEAVSGFEGFIFVTPEYNHGPAPALVNAIDYLAKEWSDKAAAFVSYGAQAGGVRAVEPLRSMLASLNVATIANQVQLSLFTDFEGFARPAPPQAKAEELKALFDQLTKWTIALRALRAGTPLIGQPRTAGERSHPG
jgi:NAD(P)H-dependent FMN reductase